MAAQPDNFEDTRTPLMPSGLISGPDAWYADDMRESSEWIYTLSAEDIED